MNLVNAAEKSESILSNLSKFDFFNRIQVSEVDYSENQSFLKKMIETKNENIKKPNTKNKI